MKWLADRVMARRARSLLARIRRHLPSSGIIADVGSGTGHNGEAIRFGTHLAVQNFDVADLHWVGPRPVIFEETHVPASNRSFDALLMLFVLQYPQSPIELLTEARRVTRGRVIILQSTYYGWLGRIVLSIRECLWGRLAFRLAALARVVSATECPLTPRRYFTCSEIQQLFKSAGFTVLQMEPAKWIGLNVSRDLFVLERADK